MNDGLGQFGEEDVEYVIGFPKATVHNEYFEKKSRKKH